MRAKAAEQLARNPLWQRPGWVAAHARLLGLIPSARERIHAPYRLTPDPILEAATDAGVPIEKVLIFNPWRANPEGRGRKVWEECETLEVFDEVFRDQPPTPGPLWFIPDTAFRQSREPFPTTGEHLRQVVADYPCDLTDDTVFIWAEEPRVTVIHHEGAFFHLDCARWSPLTA